MTATHLLLVEDNPGDARLVREILGELPEPITIVEADRISAAVESLEQTPIDVVLLDLGLPDGSGIEAVQKIMAAAPEVPIVVLSGQAEASNAVDALRAGAQDYLIKGELDGRLLVKTLYYARERKRLQIADQFLAEAGRLLAGTLDYEDTLTRIGEFAVRSIADVCIIDLVDEEGEVSRRKVAYREGLKGEAPVQSEEARWRVQPKVLREVLETGRSIVAPQLTGEEVREFVSALDLGVKLEDVQVCSAMVVPLSARDKRLGAMLFGSLHRSYGSNELTVAERLADIAALQIENASLYRRAQEAVRARDRVLGVVAHDLRNPLGTISMITELLLEGLYTKEQEIKQLNVVRRSVDRMDLLIQDLLDVVRLEANRLSLNCGYQEPSALAQECVELNSALAATKSINLQNATSGSLRPIVADHDRVIRVLDNLVGNAIKFSPDGSKITVSVAPDEGGVRFSVIDQGPGIPAAEIPELFQPFWQARRSPTTGAGLGLAIAKGIIEAHEGKIWAESSPGSGTTFSFFLPAGPERRSSDGGEKAQASRCSPENQAAPGR